MSLGKHNPQLDGRVGNTVWATDTATTIEWLADVALCTSEHAMPHFICEEIITDPLKKVIWVGEGVAPREGVSPWDSILS